MKGKIKILSLVLALAMTSSMLVACGNGLGETSSQGSNEATTSEASKDLVKLSWYTYGEAPKKDYSAIIKALNEKSMKDINTEIDFKFTTGNDEKVKVMMATGGDFDIVFTCAWFANYVVSAQGNQLADITEKVKTVTPELYEYIPQVVWEGSKVNGKIYAIPTYKDTAAAQYWTCNKDYVFDKVGAEKEFRETGFKYSTVTPLLEKIKAYADANAGYPNDLTAPVTVNWQGLSGYDNAWDTLGLTMKLGIKIESGNTTVTSLYSDPEVRDNMATLKLWHDMGLMNKSAIESEQLSEYIVVSSSQAWDGAEAVLQEGKGYNVAMNKKYGPIYTTSYVQGSMNGISPNSKNIDRALIYLQYANMDKDYRNMLGYGVEGVDWKLNEQGQAETLTDTWLPSKFAQASFFELYPQKPAPADMYVNLKATNDSAKSSPLIGFVPNIEKFKTNISACTAIFEKHDKAILTGTNKDSNVAMDAALKELNAAGYDTIIYEIQKQVDDFIAAK